MRTQHLGVMAVLLALACGTPPLTDPFSGLQAGVCLDDTDCEIGRCPNACHLGQPYCTYPGVFARADILRKCPCVETPSLSSCQPPEDSACGPQPKCASRDDVGQLRARCLQGMCAARMTDGGVPP